MVVAALARDFVRNSMSSRVDDRALNFVPSSFDTFINSTINRILYNENC